MARAAVTRLDSYESMSREQAIARLKVAEDALVLIGWSSTKLGDPQLAGSERADAAEQMWGIWYSMVGYDVVGPHANPEIDAMVPGLAAQRREIRERTLRAIREADQ